VIIFVEFQTNNMSADGINDMSAQAPKKIPPQKRKNLHIQNLIAAQKGLEGSLRGTFPQKVPLKN
ncbi:MAG: hypothetical protein J6D10_01685, partial [Clostridia bacterium]|nr:hypothetical protein [Clostridia bacterium]